MDRSSGRTEEHHLSNQEVPEPEIQSDSRNSSSTQVLSGLSIQEEGLNVGNIPLAGRLRFFEQNWSKITTNTVVLNWIKGDNILFKERPVQCGLPPIRVLSQSEINSMSLAIEQLVSKGVVSVCTPCSSQFISSIFTVSKSDGSDRLILNLKK